MPRPLALSGLAVAVPTQMLLRRYTIEIWPLHRMVKFSLPIAGETGPPSRQPCGALPATWLA
jgi:hypothetical protein